MNDTIEAAGWVVYTSEAIYGTGKTRAAAMTDAREWLDNELGTDPEVDQDIVASPATAALIEQVENEGGATQWSEIDGVACTIEEADEAA